MSDLMTATLQLDDGRNVTLDAVCLDMGGVLLDLGPARALPWGEHDVAGRERLRDLVGVDDDTLDRLLFAPFRADYGRRYETQVDADWTPHLERLLGVVEDRDDPGRVSHGELLDAWASPYADSLTPEPGAPGAVAALREMGLALVVVSNVPLPGRFYERALERFRMLEHLEHRFFSHDAGSRKPAPQMIEMALDALGVAPERAAMVGDRRATDIAAGRAAGVTTIQLTRPAPREPDGPQPHLSVEDLAALAAHFAAPGC
jgi:putative hydrolase of the HAD superfamily